MKAGIATFFAASMLLAVQVAAAHHAFSMYDSQKDLLLEGTVSRFQWTNPHCWVRIVVTDPTGKDVQWNLEGHSPNVLMRQGWKRDSIRTGDKAQILIHPIRDGSHVGSIERISVNGQLLGTADPGAATTP